MADFVVVRGEVHPIPREIEGDAAARAAYIAELEAAPTKAPTKRPAKGEE